MICLQKRCAEPPKEWSLRRRRLIRRYDSSHIMCRIQYIDGSRRFARAETHRIDDGQQSRSISRTSVLIPSKYASRSNGSHYKLGGSIYIKIYARIKMVGRTKTGGTRRTKRSEAREYTFSLNVNHITYVHVICKL